MLHLQCSYLTWTNSVAHKCLFLPLFHLPLLFPIASLYIHYSAVFATALHASLLYSSDGLSLSDTLFNNQDKPSVSFSTSFILPCFGLHSYRLGIAWDNAWDSAGPFMALGWSRMPLLLWWPSDVCWHEGWCSVVFPTENESHWGPGQHFVLGRARKCIIKAMLLMNFMIKASPTLASCALVIARECYSVLRELHSGRTLVGSAEQIQTNWPRGMAKPVVRLTQHRY